MSKGPVFWAIIFGLALLITYFGFNTISPEVRNGSSSKNLAVTGIENLEQEALTALNPSQKAELEAVKKNLTSNSNDSLLIIDTYKTLSGFWFLHKEAGIAGAYAKKAAELIKTDTAWSIAGTTFIYGLEEGLDEKKRQFCFQGAIQALESAISFNPANPDHALNLAMVHVKMPGENPMKGIMMLRDVETNYPEYEPVQFQLAALAIQTGQFERSRLRMEKLLAKNPNHPRANCMMVEILVKMNMAEEAKKYSVNCK
jgi:tetratricopeptide (TPR) repeat protein